MFLHLIFMQSNKNYLISAIIINRYLKKDRKILVIKTWYE